MKLRQSSNGSTVQLDPSSEQKGGEGSVYQLSQNSDLVAKVYHDPAHANEAKLRAMLLNPPRDPMSRKGHVSIAWPLDLLEGRRGRTMGFVMPRAKRSALLYSFIRPNLRRKKHPTFTYRGLHRLARNVASAFSAVHAEGHVVCDVNPRNTLATEGALACLIDCDSFQIQHPRSQHVFICGVGMPEFTPPEHQRKRYGRYRCDEAHDHFGLAALLFMLLMEGTHPFAGRYLGSGDAPTLEERIAAGQWPYARQRRRYRPRPASPPLSVLSPHLQRLFHQSFVVGHSRPQARPDARTWKKALEEAERALVRCKENSQHWHGQYLRACPWCERTRRLGTDPYPSRTSSKRSGTSSRASQRLGFSAPSTSLPTARKMPARSTSESFLDQLKKMVLKKALQWLISALKSAFSPGKKGPSPTRGATGNTIGVDSNRVKLDRNPTKIG